MAVVLVAAAGANAANLYWVGSSGDDWSTSAVKWATTSGGAATTAWVNGSDAVFDANSASGFGDVDVENTVQVASITVSDLSGSNPKIDDTGTIELGAGGVDVTASTGGLKLQNSVWKLTADQTWSSATSGNVEIKQGSLDLNGHELTLVCTGGGTFIHKGGNGFAGTGDVVVGDGGSTTVFAHRHSTSALQYTGDLTIKNAGTYWMRISDDTLNGDLYLETGAIFDGEEGDLSVQHLYINGVAQDAGTYDKFNLGAYIEDGSIIVAEGAPQAVIPEPLTACAVAAGLAGLGGYLRRRRAAG
jgi:hypothetical protein